MDIKIIFIVYCYFLLPTSKSISSIVQKLKGKSAFIINKEDILEQEFHWGIGYFAVSVSPRFIKSTRAYINNQWSKHEKVSYEKEIKQFDHLTKRLY
ncbi:transposase [Flammeovirga agarivorans]|uniref:Transposase IS200-like domain-containing protein n=1 Tax=Flammeovirga agarivorans TaxID=2726742 RepID=A0A7X8XY01_9BACT|nr:transposase [Flammeovirga agarivorans]NLR93751.1 hypothetical protein [Flammeovirga agarivorans]